MTTIPAAALDAMARRGPASASFARFLQENGFVQTAEQEKKSEKNDTF